MFLSNCLPADKKINGFHDHGYSVCNLCICVFLAEDVHPVANGQQAALEIRW